MEKNPMFKLLKFIVQNLNSDYDDFEELYLPDTIKKGDCVTIKTSDKSQIMKVVNIVKDEEIIYEN